MSALRGPTYSAPMPFGGLVYKDDMTGKSAASVFPEEVPAAIRIWQSLFLMSS